MSSEFTQVRSDAVKAALGVGGFTTAQWLILMLIARFGEPRDVGVYTLAMSVAAPAYMFTNSGLANLVATDVASLPPFAGLLRFRLLASGVATICVLAFAALNYDKGVLLVVTCVAIAKYWESLSDLVYGLLTKRRLFGALSRTMLIRGAMAVVAVGAAVWLGWQLWAISIVLAISSMLSWLLIDGRWLGCQNVGTPGEMSNFWRIVNLCWPLGVTALLSSLLVNVPRVTLEGFAGVVELGIFGAVAYVGVGLRLGATVLGTIALPRLGAAVATGNKWQFVTTLARLLLSSAGMAVFGWIGATYFGGWALQLLYGSPYSTYGSLLRMVLVAGAVGAGATYLHDALTALRVLRPKIFVMAAAVLASGAVALGRIPHAGLAGAAEALLAGAAVELVGSGIVLFHAVPRAFQSRR